MPKLYKILVGGRSCHGGDLTWSLPVEGKPGAWHEVETVEICQSGLHLTDDPASWWKPGCQIFEAEAEGVEGDVSAGDRKVVAKRARLLREVTSAEELSSLRIWSAGEHEVSGGDKAIALGSSRVMAYGSSTVTARDSSHVEASNYSRVMAYDSSTVWAYDSSHVEACGSSTVIRK